MKHSKAIHENDPKVEGVETDLCKNPWHWAGKLPRLLHKHSPLLALLGNTPGMFATGFCGLLTLILTFFQPASPC